MARGDNLLVRFAITDGKTDIPVHYQGIVPDLFREGQGVVAEGKLESEALLPPIWCSPSTMSDICRAKVVDALKKSGRWEESRVQGSREHAAMIAELGHYALVLALGLGLIQAIVPIIGARTYDTALMRLANSTALMQFAFVAFSFAALTVCYVNSDFSVANVFENSHSRMPLIYKITAVGEPRGLENAPVGPHPRPLRRAGRGVRQ